MSEINCVFCGLEFSSLESIENHISSIHSSTQVSNQSTFQSSIINKSTTNDNSLADKNHNYLSNAPTKYRLFSPSKTLSTFNSLNNSTNSSINTAKLSSSSHSNSNDSISVKPISNNNEKNQIHLIRKIYRCNLCYKRFHFKSTYYRHKKQHSIYDKKKSANFCEKCGFYFHKPNILDIHRIKRCDILSSIANLSSKYSTCSKCKIVFTNSKYLYFHSQRICQKSSEVLHQMKLMAENAELSTANKDSKQSNAKLKKRKIKAEVLKMFQDKKPKRPYKQRRKSTKLFSCDVCHKNFSNRSSLSNHNKSHNSRRGQPFVCRECDKRFVNLLSLQDHRHQVCNKTNNKNTNSINKNNTNDYDNNTTGINNGNNNNNQSNADNQNSKVFSQSMEKSTELKKSSGNNSSNKTKPNYHLSNFNGVSQVPLWHTNMNEENYEVNSPLTTVTSDGSISYRGPPKIAVSCVHCGDRFYDRVELEEHAQAKHSNKEGEVLCLLCERRFTTNMALRVHLTKSHGFANGGCPGVSQALPPLPKLIIGGGGIYGYGYSSTSSSNKARRRRKEKQMLLDKISVPENNGIIVRETSHRCEGCQRYFSTMQALGNHRKACVSDGHPNQHHHHHEQNKISSITKSVNSVSRASHTIESLIADNSTEVNNKTSRQSNFSKPDNNIFLAFN